MKHVLYSLGVTLICYGISKIIVGSMLKKAAR